MGHNHVVRALRQVISTERVSHAYLFLGPAGVGKATVARQLAKAMVGTNQEADLLLHPDVKEVRPEGHSLRLEQIRDLCAEANLSPVRAKRKVFILYNIETLTIEAANSFLTTLEEPPPFTHFVLLADRPNVFGTIVSRCQVLRFGFLSPSDTVQVLARTQAHTGNLAAAARLSFGSPGEAGRSLAPDFLTQQAQMAELAAKLMDLKGQEKLEKITSLEESKVDLQPYVAFLALWMRDVLCFKLGLPELAALPFSEEIAEQARGHELLAIISRLCFLQGMLARWTPSTNKRLVLDGIFLATK